VARATIEGLQALKRPDVLAALRGKPVDEVTPGGLLRAYRDTNKSVYQGTGPVEVA